MSDDNLFKQKKKAPPPTPIDPNLPLPDPKLREHVKGITKPERKQQHAPPKKAGPEKLKS